MEYSVKITKGQNGYTVRYFEDLDEGGSRPTSVVFEENLDAAPAGADADSYCTANAFLNLVYWLGDHFDVTLNQKHAPYKFVAEVVKNKETE